MSLAPRVSSVFGARAPAYAVGQTIRLTASSGTYTPAASCRALLVKLQGAGGAGGDWFVTHRLRRYIAAGPDLGWRWRLADVVCRRLTDPFDPTGAHCDSEPPQLAEVAK